MASLKITKKYIFIYNKIKRYIEKNNFEIKKERKKVS
jgi:hypothetical protein